jgi:hypothetical protein
MVSCYLEFQALYAVLVVFFIEVFYLQTNLRHSIFACFTVKFAILYGSYLCDVYSCACEDKLGIPSISIIEVPTYKAVRSYAG